MWKYATGEVDPCAGFPVGIVSSTLSTVHGSEMVGFGLGTVATSGGSTVSQSSAHLRAVAHVADAPAATSASQATPLAQGRSGCALGAISAAEMVCCVGDALKVR